MLGSLATGSLIEPMCYGVWTQVRLLNSDAMNATKTIPLRRSAVAGRTLSQPLAYALSATIIGAALFASATPSPLYQTYARLWGFSPVVVTLVYATYAIGVLAALLLAGRASNVAGLGLGALTSSAVVQLLPAPRVLPYVVVLILFAVALVGVALMPEPVAV